MRSPNRVLRSKFRLPVRLQFFLIFLKLIPQCWAFFTVISFNFRSRVQCDFYRFIFFNGLITAGLTKQFSSMSFAFSTWPWLFSFSIFFSTDCCKWIGIGLPFCCISFAFSFSWISTFIPFTV